MSLTSVSSGVPAGQAEIRADCGAAVPSPAVPCPLTSAEGDRAGRADSDHPRALPPDGCYVLRVISVLVIAAGMYLPMGAAWVPVFGTTTWTLSTGLIRRCTKLPCTQQGTPRCVPICQQEISRILGPAVVWHTQNAGSPGI